MINWRLIEHMGLAVGYRKGASANSCSRGGGGQAIDEQLHDQGLDLALDLANEIGAVS